MKRRIIAIITAALISTATFALAGGPPAPLSTPELKKIIGSNSKPTLIFFQNPYGGPCRAQKTVLDQLAAKRGASYNLASISVMNQNDQKAFYDYGVRSLPMLVLVDKSGKINKVFSPGIQSIEAISAAIDGAK